MVYILILREGDENAINDYVSSLKKKSSRELVNAYNREVRIGITGVHQQALYLCALRKVLLQRFDFCPISLDDNVLSLGGPIENRLIEEHTCDSVEIQIDCHGVTYTDRDMLKVLFATLIIRVDSINRLFGELREFIVKHCSYGITNGKLLLMYEMTDPPPYLLDFAEQVLFPLGFGLPRDFVFLSEQLTRGVRDTEQLVPGLPHPGCERIPWLGSAIFENGNFIWFK